MSGDGQSGNDDEREKGGDGRETMVGGEMREREVADKWTRVWRGSV